MCFLSLIVRDFEGIGIVEEWMKKVDSPKRKIVNGERIIPVKLFP